MKSFKYYVLVNLLAISQLIFAENSALKGLVPLTEEQMKITIDSNIPSNLLIDLTQKKETQVTSPDEDLNFANDQINGSTIQSGNWQLLENLRTNPEEISQVESMIQSLGRQSTTVQNNIIQSGGTLSQ